MTPTDKQNATTLVRLIRHGVEAFRDGEGDAFTALAMLENIDNLSRLIDKQ